VNALLGLMPILFVLKHFSYFAIIKTNQHMTNNKAKIHLQFEILEIVTINGSYHNMMGSLG
jgi:hypothetical protein